MRTLPTGQSWGCISQEEGRNDSWADSHVFDDPEPQFPYLTNKESKTYLTRLLGRSTKVKSARGSEKRFVCYLACKVLNWLED